MIDVETSFVKGVTPVTRRDVSDDPALARIDHYELLRELGGGGFGTVYLARDTIPGEKRAECSCCFY